MSTVGGKGAVVPRYTAAALRVNTFLGNYLRKYSLLFRPNGIHLFEQICKSLEHHCGATSAVGGEGAVVPRYIAAALISSSLLGK